MKNIIVLQHIKIEDPGYIKDLMIKDNIKLTTIELDEGEKIPNDLSKFDAMFCMGGAMGDIGGAVEGAMGGPGAPGDPGPGQPGAPPPGDPGPGPGPDPK